MRTRIKIVLILLCGAVSKASATASVLHGEETKLRRVLSRVQHSRDLAPDIWTYGDLAILVRLHPSSMDFRRRDVPFEGQVPWRPAWIIGWQVKQQLTKTERDIFARSRVTLIHREEDGATCVVNELTGRRIFTEEAAQQDASAVEMPCEKIWSQFESLVQIPDAAKLEVSHVLRTPPPPPRFERKTSSKR